MSISSNDARAAAPSPPRRTAATTDGAAGPLTQRILDRFGERTSAAERELIDMLGLGAADIDNTRVLRALRDLVRDARRHPAATPGDTLSDARRQAFEAALADQAARWPHHDPALPREVLERALHRPLAELDADLQDRLSRDASVASQRMLSIQHQLAVFQQASTAAANLFAGLHEARRTLIQRL